MYIEFGYIGNAGATYYPINQMYGSTFTTRVYNYTEFDYSAQNSHSSTESITTTSSTTSNHELTHPITEITNGFQVLYSLMSFLTILSVQRGRRRSHNK